MRCAVFLSIAVIGLTACTPHDRSPDEIREQTARATSTAARDGARGDDAVDAVPEADGGSVVLVEDDEAAGRIIDHRPYSDSEDLVKRHVISRAEYNRIAGKIEAR